MIVVKTKMEKMPSNCRECKFQNCGLCCKPGTPEIKKSCLNKRHKDCPLVEIKKDDAQ